MARVILVAALLVVAVSCGINQKTVELINKVNNAQTSWTAGVNRFTTWSDDRLKSLVGTAVLPHKEYTEEQMTKIAEFEATVKNTIPETFDSRTQWPGCVHPIRDQARCGSCWAFGATESLSDRFCIASKGAINVILSPQDLVSCDSSDYGCQGGYLQNAWAYMQSYGVVAESCFPYQSQDGNAPQCPTTCQNSTQAFTAKKYKVSSYYSVTQWYEFIYKAFYMQKEIMATGPIEVGFSVYEDFLSYKSGVYVYTSGQLLGGHAVKVVGWGVDSASKLPYWLIANSWNTTWGEQGYFRIKRGSNECGIEDQAYSGVADVEHAPKF